MYDGQARKASGGRREAARPPIRTYRYLPLVLEPYFRDKKRDEKTLMSATQAMPDVEHGTDPY